MKKFNFLFIVVIFIVISCSEEVGSGTLLKKAKGNELSNKEIAQLPYLFGKDAYWRVKMESGDTINAILPDYVLKISGDRVMITKEGDNDLTTAE